MNKLRYGELITFKHCHSKEEMKIPRHGIFIRKSSKGEYVTYWYYNCKYHRTDPLGIQILPDNYINSVDD